MSNPWEIPTLPEHGDLSDDATHAARSRALDQWEWLELALYSLDLLLSHRLKRDEGQYRKGPTFGRRLDHLDKVTDAYFKRYPSQDNEGDFQVFYCNVRKFAERRNDIAHGMVVPWLTGENVRSGVMEFILLPAYYSIERHEEQRGTQDPSYAFNSEILRGFVQKFSDLANQARALLNRVLGS